MIFSLFGAVALCTYATATDEMLAIGQAVKFALDEMQAADLNEHRIEDGSNGDRYLQSFQKISQALSIEILSESKGGQESNLRIGQITRMIKPKDLKGLIMDADELPLPPLTSYEKREYDIYDGISQYAGNNYNDGVPGVRVQTEGPKALQGVFWITGQGHSSSIFSFARTNEGGLVSSGLLQESETYAYSIRLAGDRSWAFADSGTLDPYNLVRDLDLVYHFQLLDGTVDNPNSFRIIPSILLPLTCRRLEIRGALTQLLEYNMTLKNDPNDPQDVDDAYPGSVIWSRTSNLLGKLVNYEMVQVVDGSGVAIQPAFNKWVKYQYSPEAGSTPGSNFYRRLSESYEITSSMETSCGVGYPRRKRSGRGGEASSTNRWTRSDSSSSSTPSRDRRGRLKLWLRGRRGGH